MTASDHLNPQQFYHGTNKALNPGDPVGSGGPEADEYHPVYATTNPEDARAYARSAVLEGRGDGGEVPHRYEVEPTGPMQPDPNDAEDTSGAGSQWMSTKPMRVKSELPADSWRSGYIGA